MIILCIPISYTGCNFIFLPYELMYYDKTIEAVILKIIPNMRIDVNGIVLKGQVSMFNTLSVINVLL